LKDGPEDAEGGAGETGVKIPADEFPEEVEIAVRWGTFRA
jgi:hypothetical protein